MQSYDEIPAKKYQLKIASEQQFWAPFSGKEGGKWCDGKGRNPTALLPPQRREKRLNSSQELE